MYFFKSFLIICVLYITLTNARSAKLINSGQLSLSESVDSLNFVNYDLSYDKLYNDFYDDVIDDDIGEYDDNIDDDEYDDYFSYNMTFEDLMKPRRRPRHTRKRCKFCMKLMTRVVNYAQNSKVSYTLKR